MTGKATRAHPRGRGRRLWIAIGVMLAITAFWGDVLGTPQSSGGKDSFRFEDH